MKHRTLLLIVTTIVTISLHAQTRPAIDTSKLIDLTYDYDEKTIYWPTAKPFEFQRESWGMSPGGYWYSAGRYTASEHGGTHLDSPIHFGKGQATTEQIPLSKLIAPVIVVDVTQACAANRDYRLSAADLKKWEQANGAIPAGCIAMTRTGWGRYWPDKKRYLGTDHPGDTANLRFPGIARDAALLLVERRVAGVAIDTASMDYGQSKDFTAHQALNGAGIYGLENIANLEKVPLKGATVIALPMKIKGGSGGPVRIVALLP
jgi:kynurenine formamidase